MSEEDEDKTEHVSQRRVSQAYDDGQVPLGRDAVAVAGLAAGAFALMKTGPALRDALVRLLTDAVTQAPEASFATLATHFGAPLGWTGVVCAAAASMSLLGTVAQTKGGLWPHLALPDLSRLSEGKLSRLFKREFAVDLGMSVIKVVAVGTTAYLALRDDFLTLPRMLSAPAGAQLAAVFEPLAGAAVKVVTVMALLAGADLAVSHFRFRAKMKMTRAEAKRELREDEGDPLMRSRRRRRGRELAKSRVAVEVPRADAVVVNPTHVAVAIRYRRDEGRAPRVIAKGKGQLAEIMRDLARANGIPIVEDITLARLLYRRVKVGGAIPAETYRAVAAVLAFVYRVTGRGAGSGASA